MDQLVGSAQLLFSIMANRCVEGLIIATAMMIVSGIYGPDVWKQPIISVLPSLSHLIEPNTTIRDLWIPIIFGAFCIAHWPACVYNVYVARKSRGQNMAPLFLEWTPMVVFTASTVAWLGSSHSFILKENHLVLFCLTMSLVFGRMTTKIILAHLTKQPFPYWTVLITPLAGGALLANVPAFLGLRPITHEWELFYLRAYFVFAVIVYGRWAHLVITSICEYLGINCLTIPTAQLKANEKIANGDAVKAAQNEGVGKHD